MSGLKVLPKDLWSVLWKSPPLCYSRSKAEETEVSTSPVRATGETDHWILNWTGQEC